MPLKLKNIAGSLVLYGYNRRALHRLCSVRSKCLMSDLTPRTYIVGKGDEFIPQMHIRMAVNNVFESRTVSVSR